MTDFINLLNLSELPLLVVLGLVALSIQYHNRKVNLELTVLTMEKQGERIRGLIEVNGQLTEDLSQFRQQLREAYSQIADLYRHTSRLQNHVSKLERVLAERFTPSELGDLLFLENKERTQ